ncbi:UNVERIFIED_CONTAM: YlmGprotein 2, chloroplastic [Sesamum angustifolium]|uniref:YlmGprotein 2, chloroplastic n=1 Tax=Sesamum angustifolium TaxID=2727405 RepID=A0AAW2MH61_9LAMI
MDSCFSSKHSLEDEHKSSALGPASQFLMLLPFSSPPLSFIHSTPFFRQPLSLNPSFKLLMETSNVVREAQKSIMSNVEKCLKIFDNFRSQNAVLDKIMSFPSYLQNGCQIPRTNCQNLAMLSNSNFAAILPGDSVAGVCVTNGILNFLNIYNTLLVVRLVLTWFPNAPPAVVSPLSTLCDPYLNIFRGIIPPLGGTLDLSPILAFLVLNAFTSTAAALPAELPSTEVSKDSPSHATTAHLTTLQRKWMRRLSGNKSKSSNAGI